MNDKPVSVLSNGMVKKKILYLITKSNFGGAQKYVYDLATSLPSDQFDVAVAFGGTGQKGGLPGQLKDILDRANIRTIFIRNFTRDIYLLSEIMSFFEVLKLLRREKPDILHVNSSKAAGVGSFWGRFLGIRKIIYTVHGWPFNENRGWTNKKIIYFFSWLSCVLSHQVIVINKNDLAQGQKMWGQKNKIILIYNGIKEIDFKPRKEAREILGDICKTNFFPDEILGLTIAELHPNKNLLTLIKSISQSKSNFRYIIIGDGEQKKELTRALADYNLQNIVYLPGFIPEASVYLTAGDFFVLPSIKEGHPYTILEAGKAGLPTIGSEIPGISDILNETGNPLFPPTNSEKLAERIDTIVQNEQIRLTLGEKLKSEVAHKFSFEAMLENTIGNYLN